MKTRVHLPSKYPFAEEVPKGGSSCANCRYLGADESSCRNKYYREEAGASELGAKANRFCCMAWTPVDGR